MDDALPAPVGHGRLSSAFLTPLGRVLILLADGRERRIMEIVNELDLTIRSARRALDTLRHSGLAIHRRRSIGIGSSGTHVVWGTVKVYDTVTLLELLIADATGKTQTIIWGRPDR